MTVHSYVHLKQSVKCHPYFKVRRRRLARRGTTLAAQPLTVPALCNAYNWPTGLLGNGVIAIVELGGGWIQSDMDSFFKSIGQPVPQITNIESVDGTKNNPNQDPIDDPQHPNPDVEVALDIQVAAAAYFVATGKPAVIRVYFARDIAQAVQAAKEDGCDVCSISWGADEAEWLQSPGSAEQMESTAQQATQAGMIVFAAAGDNDSSDGGPTPANVDLPASCPHIIGCGGTTKTATTETVWNDDPGKTDGQGTGGGYSTIFPWQAFQEGAPPGPGRMVPDVAADADPLTGYQIVVHGQNISAGGTSAVAPLYSGLFAAFGKKLGFVTPKLWVNQLCFHDITQGNNGMYEARVGPDPCTGIGSPIGTKLAALFTTVQNPVGITLRRSSPNGAAAPPLDQPYFDGTAYGNGPDDFVTDASENSAVTHHTIALGGKTIAYTATAGHLVTVDPSSSKPSAKMFYVAFTQDGVNCDTRPVTFFYNGGPGSSSVYILLGSFAPKRLKTKMPQFTPPPYGLEDNPECLLDKTDLVFINPVGTGYSAAIAPYKNRNFWGVDEDGGSIKQFIKRFLTRYDRWNSPKFLYGESYGTARSCVVAWMLHEDGIDLNGVVLQSSILDYTQDSYPVGLLPTLAADAWYHNKINITPRPLLPAYTEMVEQFALTDYAAAVATYPNVINQATVKKLSDFIGIAPDVLASWGLNVEASSNITLLFLVTLLQANGVALGIYDGRVTANDTGIAASIDPLSGGNDPTMTAINGAYTVMWNTYLNNDLQFTSISAFTDLNDQAYSNWNFRHTDPTRAQTGGMNANGNPVLVTAGDLAATMSLNVDMKVLSLNGYFDAVTPFFQTKIDLLAMPVDPIVAKNNLTIRNYPSGHMIYLDRESRVAMKADLVAFYDAATSPAPTHQVRAQVRLPHRRDARVRRNIRIPGVSVPPGAIHAGKKAEERK
jgi:carboxypeptidase C (cathepsin A)